MKAGACLAVEAAKDQAFISTEEVDRVLAAAGRQLAATEAAGDSGFGLTDAECDKLVAEMKSNLN